MPIIVPASTVVDLLNACSGAAHAVALLALMSRLRPLCPKCGAPLHKVTDFGSDFVECSNSGTFGCYYSVSAREGEVAK